MKILAILAGGFGTRLQPVVSNVPKPMALVFQKPFISLLARAWLARVTDFDTIVLSVGYKAQAIKRFFSENFEGIEISYIEEDRAHGTGGALIKICRANPHADICLINGDTWFLPSEEFAWPSEDAKPQLTLLLKKVEDVSRYDALHISASGKVESIRPHGHGNGWINGGVYIINQRGVDVIAKQPLEGLPISMEKDLFPSWIRNGEINMQGIKNDMPFLDIGVPLDYLRAEDFLRTSITNLDYITGRT